MIKIDKLGKEIYNIIQEYPGITLTGIMMNLSNRGITKNQIKTRLAILLSHRKIKTGKETKMQGRLMVTTYYPYNY